MFDVAIIGCGPVGALAANLLGREGLGGGSGKGTDPYPLPRAVHLDHEMMRLFQSAGVMDRVLPIWPIPTGICMSAPAQAIRYMGTVGMARPFGWSNDYFFYQPELEAHLREGFAAMANVSLKIGAEFTGSSRGRPVHITYTQDGAEQSGRGPLGIARRFAQPGAQGAGRQARRSGFRRTWLVVDAEVDGPVRFPDIGRAGRPICNASRS
jgi:3-(3-hydroxy-phenyl)propionate hydroxylase